jgi:hypothetical protein
MHVAIAPTKAIAPLKYLSIDALENEAIALHVAIASTKAIVPLKYLSINALENEAVELWRCG